MKGSSVCLVLMQSYLMHCSAPRAPRPHYGACLLQVEQQARSSGAGKVGMEESGSEGVLCF